jgi:hypothetical protein
VKIATGHFLPEAVHAGVRDKLLNIQRGDMQLKTIPALCFVAAIE